MVALGRNPNSPNARLRRKAIYTLVIVTGLNIVCNLPTTIVVVAWNVIAVDRLEKPPQLIGFAVVMFVAIPSAADPLLFLWRNNDFKRKVKELKAALRGQPSKAHFRTLPNKFPSSKRVEQTLKKQTHTWLGEGHPCLRCLIYDGLPTPEDTVYKTEKPFLKPGQILLPKWFSKKRLLIVDVTRIGCL